ncbi:hypothetical protein [uncultured Bacteroides sp.]|uniref:hypothetical protein n=1 Tax=uncultured Bacteroides sp. TaxID=162156 RepID=UPI00258CD8BB|nr:hypothetical protein [uncultured Bacteroides sp.]
MCKDVGLRTKVADRVRKVGGLGGKFLVFRGGGLSFQAHFGKGVLHLTELGGKALAGGTGLFVLLFNAGKGGLFFFQDFLAGDYFGFHFSLGGARCKFGVLFFKFL